MILQPFTYAKHAYTCVITFSSRKGVGCIHVCDDYNLSLENVFCATREQYFQQPTLLEDSGLLRFVIIVDNSLVENIIQHVSWLHKRVA